MLYRFSLTLKCFLKQAPKHFVFKQKRYSNSGHLSPENVKTTFDTHFRTSRTVPSKIYQSFCRTVLDFYPQKKRNFFSVRTTTISSVFVLFASTLSISQCPNSLENQYFSGIFQQSFISYMNFLGFQWLSIVFQ